MYIFKIVTYYMSAIKISNKLVIKIITTMVKI